MPVLPTFLHCSCSGASPAPAPITLPAENRVRNIGPSPDAHHFFCISAACAIYERSTLSNRSEEHTSELQSLMRISYAVFCLKKKKMKKQSATFIKQKGTENIYELDIRTIE